jgi:hypothetical protein
MTSQDVNERIRETVRSVDLSPGIAVLFDRGERVAAANAKARSYFKLPLATCRNLPEGLTDLPSALD